MDSLKHECGIAMIRLLKPLSYFEQKYGTQRYALNKLYLMMEKQHNRGQEGAGIACVKLGAQPGHEYMFRQKAEGKNAITAVFDSAHRQASHPDPDDPQGSIPFLGELYMGHLRYSTTGKGGLKYVHPFLRRNNWRAKNLCLCGNFNMTNVHEIFERITNQGQCPRIYSDSYIMLEWIGHRLDRESERNYQAAVDKGLDGKDITDYIDKHMDMANVLTTSTFDKAAQKPIFDGGYVLCGITGSGELFTMRDPWGIRPAFYYADDEIVAVASERPVLQTTFDLALEQVQELQPGQALLVDASAKVRLQQIIQFPIPSSRLQISPSSLQSPHSDLHTSPSSSPTSPSSLQSPQPAFQSVKPCSFERIYFSRGNDSDIYQERKALGRNLVPNILKAIDCDVEHTVFSFIPNTAEVAYLGMLEALRDQFPDIRSEKVISKDIKLRTFITEGGARNDLAAHVYDITYGSLRPYVDNLVIIDDSIVRGTTLRESIIRILDRLHPKKLVIVSSAPQIRYPDFYGIDMSRIDDLIAYQACLSLVNKRGLHDLHTTVNLRCKEELAQKEPSDNPVRELYAAFTPEELSEEMVNLLRPQGVDIPIQFVFQSIEGLHQAIPNHAGDWYFTGHYPTSGGLKLLLEQMDK
ncbi:MAG: amidophosphoribosyltransferase [Bacteroidales bacterium]|nr:amidophosphoribosyltransferase [Candidatus Physcousia equi]